MPVKEKKSTKPYKRKTDVKVRLKDINSAKDRYERDANHPFKLRSQDPDVVRKRAKSIGESHRRIITNPEYDRPDQLKGKITPNKIHNLQHSIWSNSLEWMERLWGAPRPGDPSHVPFRPWSKQVEIVKSVYYNHLTAVHSGNSVGKTRIVAGLAITFLMGHMPSTVFTTSAGWRELEKVLWPEIRHLFYTSAIPLGVEPLMTEWTPGKPGARYTDKWKMIAVAAKDKNNFAGLHNSRVFGIGDEADGISEEIIQAMHGNTTGENDRLLLTGNPHTPGGAFYKVCTSHEWNTIHVSCFDHPNILEQREVYPGMVTQRWINLMKTELGEGTPAWKSRVEGVFPDEDTFVVIPYSWIVEATRRDPPEEMDHSSSILSVDVARSQSGDLTVIMLRDNQAVWYLESVRGRNTMQTVGRILLLCERFRPKLIAVDDLGVGGGVIDRLQEHQHDGKLANLGVMMALGVGFGEDPMQKKRFVNRRDECYWMARELLDPATSKFHIPPTYLNSLSELSIGKLIPHSSGKIKMEKKEDIIKRLKHSPDHADTFAISCDAKANILLSGSGAIGQLAMSGLGGIQ